MNQPIERDEQHHEQEDVCDDEGRDREDEPEERHHAALRVGPVDLEVDRMAAEPAEERRIRVRDEEQVREGVRPVAERARQQVVEVLGRAPRMSTANQLTITRTGSASLHVPPKEMGNRQSSRKKTVSRERLARSSKTASLIEVRARWDG